MSKSSIRKTLLRLRKKKYSKNLSVNSNKLFKYLEKKKLKSKIIGGYYPFNYELNILNILEIFEKKNYFISLPKIAKNNQMDFFKWSSNDPLKINNYGIPEPISSKICFPDILIVPLVGYDSNLNRLGYGGGFYDRYINKIKKIKKIITIGLAYSFQKVKEISINKHDIKLDFIITDKYN